MKPIKEGGVKPDVVVDLTVQALRERDKGTTQTAKPEDDLILKKALELYSAPQTASKKAA